MKLEVHAENSIIHQQNYVRLWELLKKASWADFQEK